MTEKADFVSYFNQLKSIDDPQELHSALVWLCKDRDLRRPEYAQSVSEIAQWIESPNEPVRQGVVFALSLVRPVPGYEYLASKGWRSAPAGELHWYAAAIVSSYKDASQIDMEVVCLVADKLMLTPPHEQDYDDELEFTYAQDDYRECQEQSARVLNNFHRKVCEGKHEDELNIDAADTHLDWRKVAEVLHYVGCRALARPRNEKNQESSQPEC